MEKNGKKQYVMETLMIMFYFPPWLLEQKSEKTKKEKIVDKFKNVTYLRRFFLLYESYLILLNLAGP
mgnify:CR=1 FL=1